MELILKYIPSFKKWFFKSIYPGLSSKEKHSVWIMYKTLTVIENYIIIYSLYLISDPTKKQTFDSLKT
jgi:hypothetical protein